MINSFITNEKAIETHSKIHNINCVCGLNEKKNHENNKEHYLYKIRQNFYNNHVFYSNNKFEKIPNFTETMNNLNKITRYNSNSKNKKEQEKLKQQKLFNNKINHRNKYQNINDACHSYENKKETKYNIKNNKRNIKINDFKKNNIKLKNEEMNTPEINNKKGIKTNNNINKENERNNKDDLSRTLENFKKRKNYGYKEIKYIKKNDNNNQINNKNFNNNNNKNQNEISDYILRNFNTNNQIIPDNYDFRNSLKIINKKMSNNYFSNNDDKNNNISYKAHIAKPNNANISKNTIQETQKNLNQLKKNAFIKNNCSSYKNINDYPKIKEKENYENRKLLMKQYTANTPENKNKNQKQSMVNYTKRNNNKINNNNYMNNIDTDKDNINSSRYISSELKEGSTDIKTIKNKHHNNNHLKNIIYPRYMKIQQNKESIRTIKDDFSKVFNHEKQKSFSNNIINTENIDFSKNEKNNIIKTNFKSGLNIKQLLSNKNTNFKENYIKKQDNNNDNFSHRNPPNLNFISKKKDKNNYINNSKEKERKRNNILNYNYKNNEDNNINITNRIKTEYKEPHKKLSTNNCETKKYYYNNRFKLNNLNKEDTITKSKEKGKAKEIIRKQYKSLEKKDSTEKIKIKKNLFTKNNHNRTKTKSKSKSKARKHSKCIKYLDNLKIFKFSETGYNINNNDSSTANTRNNIEEKKYRKYILRTKRNESKKKKNINSFNLQYKTYEEDFRLKNIKIKEKCKYLKPQISCRITLSKKNNVNIVGLLRYFKVNYFCSENLRCEYDSDSEDTSEYYNNKF